uniref:Solute carrier family 2 member 3b n=1 Tax=Astyanax mexicanus TaxID=7994 RepID=A0A8B9H2P1_ASTMX
MCVILSLLQRNRMTCHLLFCVCTAAIGSLQFGYNIGVINAPYKKVQAFFKNASLERYGQAMDDCTVSNLWSFAVAVFSAGGMVSSVFVGALVNKFGRTKSMLLSNTLALIGGALMGLASACRSYEMVILGRLVIGLFCGLYTGLTPMYVGELAPTAQRGAFGTLHQLAIVIGILIAQVSSRLYVHLYGTMCCFLRLLVLLRGQEDVEDDIREMKEEADKLNQEQKVSIPELFRNPIYRQPIIIAIVMNVSQQFSGINAVFYYSTQIFKSSGVSEPIYATIGTGIINTVFTVVSLFLVERAGRRTLQMFGLGGMAICALVMTIVLQLVLRKITYKQVAILAVFGFVASFEIGPGPIPWFIATELFAQDARPAAVAVGGCSNWISNFLVAMFFPMLQRACGPYVFIIFLVLLLFFLLFTYFRVPETKGRTFEDIASGFAKAASSAPANPAPLEGGDTLPVSPTTEKVPMVEFPPQEAKRLWTSDQVNTSRYFTSISVITTL